MLAVAKLAFEVGKEQVPGIPRHRERKWEFPPPVSKIASLVRTTLCTVREMSTQRNTLHCPGGASKCWDEISPGNTASWYNSIWTPPYLYWTVYPMQDSTGRQGTDLLYLKKFFPYSQFVKPRSLPEQWKIEDKQHFP